MTWITKFVEELKNDKWVLPALKQIREICQLFPEVIGCFEKQFCMKLDFDVKKNNKKTAVYVKS